MTVRILTGDVRQRLAELPDASVQMCVTSPPYWGLRSYLPPGHPAKHLELGQEPSVHHWVRTMVDVFTGVHRVLRKDGTLWLNLGESYAGDRDPKAKHSPYITGDKLAQSAIAAGQMTASRRRDNHEVPRSDLRMPGFKNKDMHGQPWRLAFALQGFAVINCQTIGEWADMLQAARAANDWAMVELVEQRLRWWDFTEVMKHRGWWLRQEIIWHKPNPMPESAKDRCTKAHEHIFLFAKSKSYHFDYKAIQEVASKDSQARYARGRSSTHKHAGVAAVPGSKPNTIAQSFEHMRRPGVNPKASNNGVGFGHGQDRNKQVGADASERMGRGPGWRATKQNESFSAAIVETVEKRTKRSVWTIPTQGFKGSHYATFPEALVKPCILAGCPIGGTVLDIFGGSGTTGLVADELRRDCILIDLDDRNESMARERISKPAPLLAHVCNG